VLPFAYPAPLQKLRATQGDAGFLFPECALMNDVSPISYFGSLMAGSSCERSILQFVPYIPVIIFTFFQIGDDMR
jgi:hypothetical protein